MVAARPNRALVELRPIELVDSGPDGARYAAEVVQVTPLPGEHDSITPWTGRVVNVLMPAPEPDAISAETTWRFRATLTGPATIRYDDESAEDTR